MKSFLAAAAAFAALAPSPVFGQGSNQSPSPVSCHGAPLTGTVRDSTLALLPNATLTLDGADAKTGSGAQTTISGPDGRFRFSCVLAGTHHIVAIAEGFASRDLALTTPLPARTAELDIVLPLATVETQTTISGSDDDSPANNASAAGPTQTISGNRLQSLADDPDDLLRELQQLAAALGGNPANVTIAVDGFQGASTLPPKSSIAYIKINPDQFSAEYQQPPFDGARVEVYTRPGQKAYHGALFLTNGSPWMNARDPFSTSKAALGKQRYGFELTGPVLPHHPEGSDFALTLEHRSIDNFAVVNAFTLDPSGSTVNTVANVATPQRLWLGTARLDQQIGPKNTFITSYSANVDHLLNLGAGGTTLAENAYDSQQYEHMLRFSLITTASATLMHEARVSLRWDGENDTPASTAAQVQVAGAFTGGGATIGPQRLHELDIEVDDDAILTTKNHTFKFGTQFELFDEHQQLTTNFNGTYTFGGGPAPVLDASGQPIPGETATISGIEQYRRTLLSLPGGTPSTYSSVTGSPTVNFVLVKNALFFQDDWNTGRNLHIAYGMRYFTQSNPTVLNSIEPRIGILWSPTKKGTWTLHAHAGLFSDSINENRTAEVRRMDGVERVTSTVSNPVYGDPTSGAAPILSIRRFAAHIGNNTWGAGNIGGTRALPGGWNLSADYYLGRIWNDWRSPNINSPLNDLPNGPRPGPPNLNILELQNSGQGRINATFAGIEQHSLKYVQIFFGTVRVNIVDDTDNNDLFSPQSSASNVGEFAHRSNQNVWNVFSNGTLTLPWKLALSENLQAGGGRHYNITTGFDNNGDGNFNDRPQYASPGTPGAVQTPWGLLVASGGTGVFPRNKGVLPWTFYLDTNLQRSFTLTRNAKAEHQQTITLNLRSSNVLNHLNVQQVGGVLGSPLFGVPYAADNGRRIEAGARYSF